MTNERIKVLRRCLDWVTGIVTVLTGICLMDACASIYFTGDGTFTREIVGAALYDLRYILITCGAVILCGLCVHGFFPAETKTKPRKQTEMVYKRLAAATDLSQCGSELRARIEAQRKNRLWIKVIGAVWFVVGGLAFLTYALNGSNFHQSEINDSMIRAMQRLAVCIGIPFVYCIVTAYTSKASIEKEIDLLKQVGINKNAAQAPEKERRPIAAKVIFVAAVVLLVYGYLSGGTADVLTKAVNICTECVGLG